MTTRPIGSRRARRTMISLVAVAGLVAAACGGSDAADDDVESTSAPAEETEAEETETEETETEEAEETEAETETEETEETEAEPEETEVEETEAEPEESAGGGRDFASLGPATGEPIIVGMVNTEGAAGLDFPIIRTISQASVDYLNEHGGFGGRPMELEICVSDSSPESSQGCAQELAGKNVEFVFLGLDLFPDYPTYAASGIPVAGVLPLFPADYAADAIYYNGGNATLGAAMAGTIIELFGATDVAIVSADNPGANGSEAAAIAAFDAAGITYRSIKGSDSETDAGFQGLVREALSDDPEVIVSLYGDAGCVGMMRGRAALGSDVPVIAANTCGAGEVLAAAGDDAEGWYFVGGGEQPDSPEILAVKAAAALEVGGDAADVSLSDLGLGRLAPLMFFTTAQAANEVAAAGGEVTGQAVYDYVKNNENPDLSLVPDGGLVRCGASESYASVCVFSLFIGTYTGDGQAGLVEGFERFDVIDYLA